MATKVKQDPAVKADPDEAAASPSAVSEEDLYEDAGDLEFYDSTLPQDPYGSMYLTHVPTYLYEAWDKLKDDEELQIGTIRQWAELDKNGQPTTRLAMLLDTKNAVHQSIPKEYNLDVKDMNLMNTFIFTEQDLPGYKNKSLGANSNIPAYLRPRPERPQDKSKPEHTGGKRRYQPYYRKAIPKKTVLAGRLRHELNCQPIDNAETRHILATRAADSLKPKATTSMLATTRNLQNGIVTLKDDKFSGFVVSLQLIYI
jgi:transcription initiation factor TFIIF subunit beta